MKTSTCSLALAWILRTSVFCGITAPREASMLVTQHPPAIRGGNVNTEGDDDGKNHLYAENHVFR